MVQASLVLTRDTTPVGYSIEYWVNGMRTVEPVDPSQLGVAIRELLGELCRRQDQRLRQELGI
jgi:hypothetical protein